MKNYLTIVISFLIVYSLPATIVDTPLSNLSQAEKSFLLGQYYQSTKSYKADLLSSQKEKILLYNIGYIYYLQNRNDSANYYANQALKYTPRYGPALYLAGLLAKERSDTQEAENFFFRSIRHHPDPEFPLFELGLLYYHQNNYEEAIDYFEAALKASDIFSFPYPFIANCYNQLGRTTTAIKTLEKGLELSYDAEILTTLIQLYNKAGELQKAKKYSGIFNFLFPEHSDAQYYKDQYPESDITNGFRSIPVRRSAFLPVGEKILYNVTLGPLKVGELYTAILDTLTYNNTEVYKVRFSLDSNPDLAFAAVLHSDYISYINKYTKQVELHYLHTWENDKIWDKLYEFDRKNHKFICRTVRKDGHIDIIEKYLPRNTIDGTSILFYARQIAKEKRSERVMTIIDENFVISDINYPDKIETIKVRGEPEKCIMIDGTNHYKGIVGFTGDFRGWFRDNEELLPVASDFKIWVGRIKVKMASVEEQRVHKYAR